VTLSPSSQPFKDDIDLKQELRSDTLDTRQDYELKVNRHTSDASHTNTSDIWPVLRFNKNMQLL